MLELGQTVVVDGMLCRIIEIDGPRIYVCNGKHECMVGAKDCCVTSLTLHIQAHLCLDCRDKCAVPTL